MYCVKLRTNKKGKPNGGVLLVWTIRETRAAALTAWTDYLYRSRGQGLPTAKLEDRVEVVAVRIHVGGAMKHKPHPPANPEWPDYVQRMYAAGCSVGGMQVCLADGSVRMVNASVSNATWVLACNPADGQVLSSNW